MPEEICSFSGLPQRSCAHCKYPRGVRYGLHRGVYKGSPVVEIVKDGGPVHPHDEHFRFGVAKARLLLTALPMIRHFAEVGDEIVDVIPGELAVPDTSGGAVKVWVEMHPEFVRSSGETIDRPWLHMRSSAVSIGVGYEKAKAICALADQLRQWVERPA